MKRASNFFVAILTVFALLITGCISKNDKSVKIGYLNISASLPLFVIQNQQIFEKENIKYEVTPFQTSNQLVDALAGNQIDIIVECSAVPVLARESKSPGKIKIFAYSDISPERPFDAIISNKEEIKQLKDLENKKIGVFPGSTAQRLLNSFLESRSINTSNITYVTIIPPNMLASLESGYIDALHTYEPTTTIALHTGKYHEVFGTVYGNMQDHNPQGVACVSVDFLNNHKKLANEVIDIFYNSFIFIEQNENEAKTYLTKSIELDKEIALKTNLLYFIPAKDFDKKYYYEYVETLKSLGEIESVIKFEVISITE